MSQQPDPATEFSRPGEPASRSRKRDRATDNDDGSQESPTKHSRTHSTTSDSSRRFGSAIADALAANYLGRRCWHCAAPAPQLAHVVPKNDNNLADLWQLGLVGFAKHGNVANAIHLCPSCHQHYDDRYHPNLVIAPSALAYFFAVEQAWQNEFPHTRAPRIPPSATAYHVYCLEHEVPGYVEMMRDETKGGLFTAYMDEYFLPTRGVQPPLQYTLTQQWHGDPMASIYRAIQAAVHIAWPRNLPPNLKEDLLQLHRLYEEGNKLMRQLVSEDKGDASGAGPTGPVDVDAGSTSKLASESIGLGHHSSGAQQPTSHVQPQNTHHQRQHNLSNALSLGRPPSPPLSSPRKRRAVHAREFAYQHVPTQESVRDTFTGQLQHCSRITVIERIHSFLDCLELARVHAEHDAGVGASENCPSPGRIDSPTMDDILPDIQDTPAEEETQIPITGAVSKEAGVLGRRKSWLWRWGPHTSSADAMERWKTLYAW
ncbi:hypothetical protein K491DRAFT_248987 [Lophiostoma macrostomum CBS 122681]|uniref:HNH nuclease domain-containing protein n=1 Tax=Lophiostoma macrostomum CBS 122681 TaxID=1314788 RepID=A0A6A6SKL6_9PLEO|nr:hypothetical protein K491DRAFT_248987 [Lophiostoma macrostomum CBS 122681]